MNLFFLRHGKPYARSSKWRPDSKRPLTAEGEKRMFEEARGIERMELSFDLILTSPYLRALRTAEILQEALKSKKMIVTRNLVAEADPKAIIDEINEKHSAMKQIVLAGHEPFLSRLISILLTGQDTMSIELKKGGLCKLSVTKLRLGQCASLDWLMTPGQLSGLRHGKS
ncbi:MAG TPA: phosphohistidine phosphatase SixA [Candidatus Saccharimonadales bacterium]|nr:phosphohistidine phosphatase SixA [Candidatus Saccharimonadales bacterium]